MELISELLSLFEGRYTNRYYINLVVLGFKYEHDWEEFQYPIEAQGGRLKGYGPSGLDISALHDDPEIQQKLRDKQGDAGFSYNLEIKFDDPPDDDELAPKKAGIEQALKDLEPESNIKFKWDIGPEVEED